MAAIEDFRELEDTLGTFQAERQLGEELEMHGIEVQHNVLGCQNCNLLERPVQYCRESRYHISHPLHECPMTQYCGCLDN